MNSQRQSQSPTILSSSHGRLNQMSNVLNVSGIASLLLLASLAFAQPKADLEVSPSKTERDRALRAAPKASTKRDRANSTKTIISKVQSFYANANDLKADFKQTYTYKIYGREKISTGAVYFKKPAKMRWDYEAPTQRVFVADGQTLWVYEPEEAQVFKRPLSSAQLPIALRFMRGDAKLDQEFKVISLEDDKQAGVSKLSLSPKTPSPDFKMLILRVSQESGQVFSSALVDPTDNINRIDFVDVKVNQDLPDQGFSFTPPSGVRIIDEESTP